LNLLQIIAIFLVRLFLLPCSAVGYLFGLVQLVE
jgi:hypothetical protein